ncbi:MAG: hypothetical protein IPK74_26775 [Deltaproteobacteria bacterium]|nr:hypothetical protein [Deltaproteobacteria bacterium]
MFGFLGALACGPSPGSGSGDGGSGEGGPTTTTTATGSASASESSGPGSSTTANADGSGSGEASDDGSGYLLVPDHGPSACVTLSLCDLWAQDCNVGEKCVPWVADGSGDPESSCLSTRCSTVAPDPVAPGGTCTVQDGPWSGFDDCEVGSYCWGVDPVTLEGTCAAVCGGNEANPLCGDGEVCFQGFSGIVVACTPTCDPLAPTCDAGSACVMTDGAPPACLPAEFAAPAEQGAPCDHRLGCTGGFVCMAADAVAGCADPASCCTAVCDVDAPTCAAQTPVCTPLVGVRGAGACTVE